MKALENSASPHQYQKGGEADSCCSLTNIFLLFIESDVGFETFQQPLLVSVAFALPEQ